MIGLVMVVEFHSEAFFKIKNMDLALNQQSILIYYNAVNQIYCTGSIGVKV